MRRTVTGIVSAILVVSGCVAAPNPSARSAGGSPSAGASPSPASQPSGSRGPSVAPLPTVVPTEDPGPTLRPYPTDVPPVAVPAGIDDIAWAGMQIEPVDANRWVGHLYGGLLGSGATIAVDIDNPTGYPNPVVAGGIIVATSRSSAGTIRVTGWTGSDGTPVIDQEVDGVDGSVVPDPDRDLFFVAASQARGGVEIRRRSFDGTTNDLLVTLDKRFTPDGMPTEHYGLTLDPDGVLIVEACGDADGCRLWEIPPGAPTAPKPRTLPKGTVPMCQMVGATDDWLIVQDYDVCFADYGEAPLPVRAIRRSDLASHVVTNDHVSIARVVDLGGRTSLIGVDDVFIGATVDLVEYDVVTGKKTVLQARLAPNPSDQAVVVLPTVLPHAWVLLAPGFIDATGVPSGPAHLLDLSTGATIELPVGTFGWS